ncbi:fluoride efflux transporter CrcB [Novosphingobium rosa]|jgi:CrcB protein|uniref:fluoride efflux transporter CrcB n=1 Tax=Novosphingobium rosa TaxID=76978 RepID=UPI000A65F695|nr:fluoride efflux transporter CrcB [Novosphingobium rosa]
MLMTSIWIAIGGALGTLARFWLNLLVTARLGETMPWGTILINVTGSFAIGLFAAATDAHGRFPVSPDMRLFLIVGLCGGYTTFSSFSLQTITLFETGEGLRAGANVLLSVFLCLIAVWVGLNAPEGLEKLIRK